MFRIIISLVLTSGFFISLSVDAEDGHSRRVLPRKNAGDPKAIILQRKVVKESEKFTSLIMRKPLTRSKCQVESGNITSIRDWLSTARSVQMGSVTEKRKKMQDQLQHCLQTIQAEIKSKPHPLVSGQNWYRNYIEERKYEEDFKKYPQLEKQFKGEIERTYQKINSFNNALMIQSQDSYLDGTPPLEFYINHHPHLKDPELPDRYNDRLTRLKEQRTCNPDKIQRCHENLLKQLAGDSRNGLKAYCHKALREGQVCCSNPNKNCGDFSFAKDIAKTFSKSTPQILQTFARLRGIERRPEEACQLSALGGVITPLGNIQIDSCNQAVEGCKEVCDLKVAKFREDFKKCYKVQKGESIKEIIGKAANEKEGFEEGDPKAPCKEEIAEVAEAYKEMSIDSSYSLSEESDHEEVIACRGAIEKYAPTSQNMGPAEQLAVNMCYRQIETPTAQRAAAPTGPGQASYLPNDGVAGLAGALPRPGLPSLSRLTEEEGPGAPEMEDDGDFLPAGPEKPEGSNPGFKHAGGSGGGSGGGGGGLGAGGGGGGGSGKNTGGGARALTGGKLTGGGNYAFQKGEEGGEGEASSWEEGDDRIEANRKKAEELKKLKPHHLDPDEKDLIRAFSPPGKNENIFDYHSFFLHWYCRNYKCSKYDDVIETPGRWKTTEPEFKKKEDVEKKKGVRAKEQATAKKEVEAKAKVREEAKKEAKATEKAKKKEKVRKEAKAKVTEKEKMVKKI